MTLRQYLTNAQFFPLMGLSSIVDIASDLDKQMKLTYGNRTCGSLIDGLIQTDGSVTEDDQEYIAKTIYRIYKNKWDALIQFANEEIDPLVEKSTKTISKYGKTIDDEFSGSDQIGETEKLAGFDSEVFVNKDSTEHTTTYGKKSKSTNGGEDTKTVESRSHQAESLVDYTLNFWSNKGITRTLLWDSVQSITLPLYSLD